MLKAAKQRDTRLLIRFLQEIVAAGLQPGLIRTGFILFCVRELTAGERGGIALQRSAQLRQRLTFKIVKRRGSRFAGVTLPAIAAAWFSGTLFRQSRQRQDQR